MSEAYQNPHDAIIVEEPQAEAHVPDSELPRPTALADASKRLDQAAEDRSPSDYFNMLFGIPAGIAIMGVGLWAAVDELLRSTGKPVMPILLISFGFGAWWAGVGLAAWFPAKAQRLRERAQASIRAAFQAVLPTKRSQRLAFGVLLSLIAVFLYSGLGDKSGSAYLGQAAAAFVFGLVALCLFYPLAMKRVGLGVAIIVGLACSCWLLSTMFDELSQLWRRLWSQPTTMDLYLAGGAVAFAIGCIKTILTVISLYSVRTANMRQVGMHYAFMSANFVPEKANAGSLAWFAVFMLVLAPLGSWLSVVSAAWTWLRWRSTQASTPEAVRGLQYRLAHVAMNKEQMIEWQEAMATTLGLSGPIRTGAETTSDPLTLVLAYDGWGQEVTMRPDQRRMDFSWHTPDWDCLYFANYEYRFDGDVLLRRLVEKYSDDRRKKSREVQDGVVLVEQIENTYKGLRNPERAQEIIESLRTDVLWQPVQYQRLRFFVMTMHPALFPHAKITRLVRTEIQRLRAAAESVSATARKLGFDVVEKDDGVAFSWGKEMTAEQKAETAKKLSAELDRSETTYYELENYKKSKGELLKIIGAAES